MPSTTRLQIPSPGGGAANNIPADLQALADQVDELAAGWLAPVNYGALPAAGPANDRFIVYVTDARALFRSDGAAWSIVPDVTSMTTAQRNALVAGGKPTGRAIFNSTTGKHEWWNGAAWKPLGGETGWFTSSFLAKRG